MIQRADVDRVLAANPILPLAQQYLPRLRRAGTEYMCCCAWHKESTPSFSVSPAKGLWHCWGACHKGGNAVDLVMRFERISFPNAVRLLADRGGISLSNQPNSNKDAYVAMLKAECIWFWEYCRRRYSNRETAMASCRNGIPQPATEDEYWLYLGLWRRYARSAARWHRIIARLDATPGDKLLARYMGIRQRHPGVVRMYRQDLDEERAWARDWAAWLAGM